MYSPVRRCHQKSGSAISWENMPSSKRAESANSTFPIGRPIDRPIDRKILAGGNRDELRWVRSLKRKAIVKRSASSGCPSFGRPLFLFHRYCTVEYLTDCASLPEFNFPPP